MTTNAPDRRQATAKDSGMTQNTIVRTAGELIEALKAFDPASKLISHEPPFTGVQLVEQGNGSILLASLWNSDEGRAYRAASKHQPQAKAV
jgi:Iap family predicted aminopeptidase